MANEQLVPTFADQDKLPEVWAYVEELYRWRPAVPGGPYSILVQCGAGLT